MVPSVREICGADDVEISSCVFGDVVPRPKNPLALSKTNCDASPAFPNRIVEDAEKPFVKSMRVVVEFAAMFQLVVGVYGNEKVVALVR